MMLFTSRDRLHLMTVFAAAVSLSSCLRHPTVIASPTSVAALVAKHVDAIGGQANLAAIQSIQAVGILDERGTLHPMFTDRRRPNLLRVRMIHGGDLIFTEVYTGTRSWEGPPGKENCRPDSAAMSATRHAADQFEDPLLAALAHAASARLMGRTTIGARDLYQIDVTQRDSTRASYYIDAQTFMLSRVRNQRPLHPTEPSKLIELVLDDFRPVSGVLFPFRGIERDVESGEPLTTYLSLWVEANVPISGNPYALPQSCG